MGHGVDKVTENRLRAVAKRRGWQLKKKKRYDRQAVDYGRYALVSIATGEPLGGKHPQMGIYRHDERFVRHFLERLGNGDEARTAPETATARLRVWVEKAPGADTPREEWERWCEERGLKAVKGAKSGRRAFDPQLEEYLGDRNYLLYLDGKRIGFAHEEDLLFED